MTDKTADEQFEVCKALLDSTRREILDAIPKEDSHAWKLVTLLLPIVFTSALGVWAYIIQGNINQRFERESNALQARLALTQGYYGERLRTYKDVHERVIALRDRAKIAALQSAYDAGLDKPIGDLYHSYSASSIFISNDLLAALTDLWNKAVGATRADTVQTNETEAVAAAAESIEILMRKDLQVDQVDQATAQRPQGL